MGVTPLFTDSNYLYVISYKKPEKGKPAASNVLDDEEEEEKEEGPNAGPVTTTAVLAPPVPLPVAFGGGDGGGGLFYDPVPVPVQQAPAQTQQVSQVQSKKNRDDSTNFQYVLELYEIGKTDFKARLVK